MLVDEEKQELHLEAMAGLTTEFGLHYRQPLALGISGHVYRTCKPYNAVDLSTDPLYVHPRTGPIQGSELAVPLVIDGRVIGVLAGGSPKPAAFTVADERVLSAVADQVAVAIHVAQLHDTAKKGASTDGLTGLANHRAFYDALDLAISREKPFTVGLFDVEGLKLVNDTIGHLAGDALLRDIAATLRDAVRETDTVARYGGDEFGLIMIDADEREAVRVAALVRQEMLKRPVPSHGPRPTVRFGVAAYPRDGQRATDLVAVADARLYQMRGPTARSEKSGGDLVASG
jgi:diguanylate cyclase (GGDEF)-like protein